MAALHFLLSAALLATALALPPTTTQTDSRKSTLAELRRTAETECSVGNPSPRTPSNALCYMLCLFKSFGALDKDGRYVETKMADLLWTINDKWNRVGGNTESRANTVAKACNYMNDETAAVGCERARQVSDCIYMEIAKMDHIIDARRSIALEEWAQS